MSILGKNSTANLFNTYKSVTVTVAAGTATKANTADTELKGGKIIGVFPSAGTADKIIQLVSLASSTGVVTVTLNGNTTADITYTVVIALASGDIA